MWIRSQDKGYLVKNPIIDIDIKKNEVYILDRTYAKEPFIGRILGVYKSKERAIEVLDEIQNLLIPKVILNTYSVENKETAYSKELVIEPIINDIKVQNNVNMFYQMPEE